MLVLLDKIRMKSNLCLQYKREKELKDAAITRQYKEYLNISPFKVKSKFKSEVQCNSHEYFKSHMILCTRFRCMYMIVSIA